MQEVTVSQIPDSTRCCSESIGYGSDESPHCWAKSHCSRALVQLLCNWQFRVEHSENDHYNKSFPTGLFDATSKKKRAFQESGW
jgi:hypothetical protein